MTFVLSYSHFTNSPTSLRDTRLKIEVFAIRKIRLLHVKPRFGSHWKIQRRDYTLRCERYPFIQNGPSNIRRLFRSAAFKTGRNISAQLIRWKTAILEALKHPTVLETCDWISWKCNHLASIATDRRRKDRSLSISQPLQPHSLCFAHGDLKPINILLDWDENIRIRDFHRSTGRMREH